MPDYLPPITTLDDAKKFADQIIHNGLPLVDGGGLLWDQDIKAMKIDPAAITSTEVVDAREGNTNWADTTTITFADLDARLDRHEIELALSGGAFFGQSATTMSFLFTLAGFTPVTGSLLWFGQKFLDTAGTQGGQTWSQDFTTGLNPIAIGGFSLQSFPSRSLQNYVTVAHPTFGAPALNAAPAAYSQAWANNCAMAVAECTLTLASLIQDLKAKGVLQ